MLKNIVLSEFQLFKFSGRMTLLKLKVVYSCRTVLWQLNDSMLKKNNSGVILNATKEATKFTLKKC